MPPRRATKKRSSRPEKKRLDATPVEFARIHIIMLFLLVLFFGILIVPYCVRKIQKLHYKRTEAVVKNVVFQGSDPLLAIVDIEYTSRDRKYVAREILHQSLAVNDTVVIYVDHYSPDRIAFTRPDGVAWIILLSIYCLLVIYCIYLLWHFFLFESTSTTPSTTK